ncbi:MAG: hypothetical protein E7415_02620 [Ruminococcaceae bacterium]|nr:hypothetical protein [Oscillospiraceae bacterium]
MKRGFYVTISETGKYYGNSLFEPGEIVKISKDKANDRQRGIRVTLPLMGIVGYLASEDRDLVRGTLSANKIYDKIGKYAYAQVMFVSEFNVIAKILHPREVVKTPYLRAYVKRKSA